jgi:branched-chain amino acid transport system ATP-binding protein
VSALLARDLHKSFGGVAAVCGVSFSLEAGEMLALIGPNGAGKSTCFNMLTGQLRPDRGRILLDEHDITGLAPRHIAQRGVGRTFQITATFTSMTVLENVQTALLAHRREIWRMWRPARRRHVGEAAVLLDQVGLGAYAQRAAAVLAYGDLKRLELAMALAGAPRLLLMDEPTAGMAPAERTALMRLVRRLAGERNMAVLFTEHDMDIVFGVAERILVLHQGELIAAGDGETIRADARVREVYLGSAAFNGGH